MSQCRNALALLLLVALFIRLSAGFVGRLVGPLAFLLVATLLTELLLAARRERELADLQRQMERRSADQLRRWERDEWQGPES